ncbi:hypothetical protein GvMRE_IIg333 [endosymbiont GvMRE of Glomus versiforme]|nr:hypothetical protein GvMRE_IIg333 [endosymbiont GvMRE of Glomus versiforme]
MLKNAYKTYKMAPLPLLEENFAVLLMKNAERILKQAKKSLKEAIKRHKKGESININEASTML